MRLNKKSKTLLGGLALLVAARVALPFVVLHYANKTLAEDLEGYTGYIDDVDIALYRGAYRIDGMVVEQVANDIAQPFLTVEAIDFSVQWESILEGAVTGEVVVERPEVVFAFGEGEGASQTGEEVDWVEVVTDLMPITINRFAIEGGAFELLGIRADPQVDIEVADVDFEVHNIRNVVDDTVALPSPFTASANFPGYGGTFAATGGAQLLKATPDFDYDARLENFDLTTLNELAQYYAGLDFEKGSVSVYSELALADGNFAGYVKPLLKDVQIFSRDEGDRTVGEFFKELFAEGLQELLENHRKDQIATRVPLEGSVESVETGVYTAILAVLRNAYFDAFRPRLDGTVEFDDAVAGGGDEDERGFFKKLFGGGGDVDDDPEQTPAEEKADTGKNFLGRVF